MKVVVTFLVVTLLCAVTTSQDGQFTPTAGEQLKNIILSDSKILLGTNGSIYRLDLELTQEERRILQSANRLLVADSPNGTLNGTVLTCDDDECLLLDTQDFEDVKWDVPRSMMLLSGGGNAAGSFSLGPNSTSDITFGEPANGIRGRRFVKGALRNVRSINQDEFLRYATLNDDDPDNLADFVKDNFLYSGFIYFTIQPSQDEHRIVRFCQKDPGQGIGERSFSSRYEIKLQCGSLPVMMSSSVISSSATYIPSGSGEISSSIVLTVNSMSGPGTMDTDVCVFSVDDINQKMLAKLTSCANGVGMVGFDGGIQQACPDHFEPEQVQTQINEPCVLRAGLVSGLEVENPLMKSALISTSSGMEQFTSLLSVTLDSAVFLFAGTNTGTLHQYHLVTSNQSVLVRTIDLESTTVNKIIASDNGEDVYAMTERKLYRHTVDMCQTYTSCESCSSSNDPVCGWCSLRGQCTRQKDCDSVLDKLNNPQSVWIVASDKCPVITEITPSIIYFRELTSTIGGSMEVALTTTDIDTRTELLAFDYLCRFTFNVPGSPPVDRTASRAGDVFTCRSPLSNQVPTPVGSDSVATTVSLRVAQTDTDLVSLTDSFQFTNCSIQTTCTGCITSDASKCKWCPFSHMCIPDGAAYECSTNSMEVTVDYTGECPQIKPPSSSTTAYLIHANHSYDSAPLVITTSNLSMFRDQFDSEDFRCVICRDSTCTSPLFSVPAVLESSGLEVRCEKLTYTAVLKGATLDAELRLVGMDDRRIDNPDNAIVSIYDCANMGTNCGQCLAIQDRYQCSYCGTDRLCRLNSMCAQGQAMYSDVSNFNTCERPKISDFSPMAGPTKGGTEVTINGTNLGAVREHIEAVMIDGVHCNLTEYTPGISIKCITGRMEGSLVTDYITVRLMYHNEPVSSLEQFMFETPNLSTQPATPAVGPQSGGSSITIHGQHIDIGSRHNVYIGTRPCAVTDIQPDRIQCTTSMADSAGVGQVVRVEVDNWNGENSGFEYVEDPVFESIEPKISFAAGGTNFTIRGTNLHSVQDPRLLIYVGGVNGRSKRQAVDLGTITLQSPMCLIQGTDTLYCQAPPVELNGSSTVVGFGILMDDVMSVARLNGTLTVHPNPTFERFNGEIMFSQNDAVTLTVEGQQFLFTTAQVKVRITPCENGFCECVITNVTGYNTLMCEVSNINHLPTDESLSVTVHVGNYSRTIGTVRIQASINLIIILIPIFAGVIILSVAIFIVLVAVFCRNSRRKDQRYDQLILELEKLESSVARECKLGFAELQTDLDDITDIAGCRLPYRDMQTYLLTTLFPGVKDHPVLHPIQIPAHRQPQISRALEDFNYLIHDKKVLLLFVRSLEEERGFTMRDKSVVGSLLMVALINRFDYATDVLKSLLSDLIRKTVANSYPKLLLRRTETVAERMLTNWLAFCLHGYIMEHVGQPLYLTYRAVKTQLEKGPIDVITGEARYSLSEQKLIRQKIDAEVVDVFIDSEDGLRIPVKLLNCDTISQVKEKLLDATFKAAPVAQRPSLKSVDLVYIKSPTDQAILRDEDSSTDMDGSWKRINTLKHYWVQNGALFRLVRRKEHPPPGRAFDYPGSLISTHSPRQRALSEAEDGTRVWHLFKQLDVEDPRRSPFLNKKMVTEIYLPRMLSTKSILQKFVDDLFHSLFTMSHPPVSPTATYSAVFPQSPGVQVPMGYAPGADAVPMAVKYLFDFLDDEADNAKISDADVVHTWKNNALSLRFWVNMIKNPEFIFDINKSHTVDACLSVIAQAFIDGCSFQDAKLTIDSPTSKLLYNKEVQGYKVKVRQYYEDIRNLPRVPEDAMQYYLKQLSVYQARMTKNSGGFIVESALYELMRYAAKYRDPIISNLRSAGLESKAQVFDGIVKVLQQ